MADLAAHEKTNEELIAACERGDTQEAVRLVTSCGADDIVASLHAAATNGHAGTVRALVTELGAAVDAKAFTGMTALHYAAGSLAEGSAETCRVLAEELGATVNARDNSGWTPFIMAARTGNFETVLLLARLGADVNGAPEQPAALHYAAGSGRVDVIRSLIRDFGAVVDAVGWEGRTPLHCAAASGESEAAVALVQEFGANIEAKTINGRTPLNLATESNCAETARVLVDTLGASDTA